MEPALDRMSGNYVINVFLSNFKKKEIIQELLNIILDYTFVFLCLLNACFQILVVKIVDAVKICRKKDFDEEVALPAI